MFIFRHEAHNFHGFREGFALFVRAVAGGQRLKDIRQRQNSGLK